MADTYIYNQSLENTTDLNPTIDKEVNYVMDTNGGSYNGQIQIDSSSWASSSRWFAWSEGYLEIPFYITLKNANNMTGTANAFMAGIKNGYYQIIDSVQVDMSNTNVVQLTNYANFHVNYRVMTSWSSDDLKKHGAITGVCPDSAGSFVYADHVAAAGGDGFSNNRDLLTNNTFTTPEQCNTGFLNRKRQTTAFSMTAYGTIPTMNTYAKANNVAKNVFTDDAGAGAARYYMFLVTATIRLKDLCPFFSDLPLIRGAKFLFNINYNSCDIGVTVGANTLVIDSYTQTSGRTCPIMLSNATANNSGALTAGALTIRAAVGSVATSQTGTPVGNRNLPLSTARLYVPSYELNPFYDKQLMDNPIRKHQYDDIYSYVFTTGSTSFNQTISTQIKNPKKLIILPYVSSDAKGVGSFLNVSIPEYQSPFSSAPNTTSPLVSITNLSVNVAGANVYQQPINYDYEEFMNELSQTGINGGVSTGLCSGLISLYDFQNAYRYYVVDLSRRLPVESNKPVSISVSGTVNPINNNRTLDLVCFITYERTLNLNISNSQILN